MSSAQRKISFPPDSVLNAVIQDADISELVKILRNKRGKVNINQQNHVGLSALHQAVLSNNLDAVKMLLTHGSDVNAQDVNGFSPLHTASACGFIQISSLLIVFGADVFLLNKLAEYPIDVAKDLNIVRLLSEEMYRRLHSELYIHSLFLNKLSQLLTAIQRILKYIYRAFISTYSHCISKNVKQIRIEKNTDSCNSISDSNTSSKSKEIKTNNHDYVIKDRTESESYRNNKDKSRQTDNQTKNKCD